MNAAGTLIDEKVGRRLRELAEREYEKTGMPAPALLELALDAYMLMREQHTGELEPEQDTLDPLTARGWGARWDRAVADATRERDERVRRADDERAQARGERLEATLRAAGEEGAAS